MEKVIDFQNIRSFAYVNDRVCVRPVKGIILNFFGLGNATMYQNDTMDGEYYGACGLLYIVPYLNPWAWMNRAAVHITDEIVEAVSEGLGLENLPVVSSGGSMGGLSAIVYTAYAKRTPALCVANCPVCDAVFHYGERPDLPRTMYSALCGYEGTLEEALESISPLHLVGKLPHIPYRILHCDEDRAVAIDRHSLPFAEKMRAAGYDISLEIVHGRGHCDLGLAGHRSFAAHILGFFE